jgi:hypothetical protein
MVDQVRSRSPRYRLGTMGSNAPASGENPADEPLYAIGLSQPKSGKRAKPRPLSKRQPVIGHKPQKCEQA